MKVEDNFLDQEELNQLQSFFMSDQIAWRYNDSAGLYDSDNEFQFEHLFYINNSPSSTKIEKLNSLLIKIDTISIWRIKANLLTRTPDVIEKSFHVDIGQLTSEEKLQQWTTSIFYVNTNDGYTEFEDGTKIHSVENRMITFPANLKHRGTSCTDAKVRVIINFDYFNGETKAMPFGLVPNRGFFPYPIDR